MTFTLTAPEAPPVDAHERQVRRFAKDLRLLCSRIRDLRVQLRGAEMDLSRALEDSAPGLADADHREVCAVLRDVADAVRP